MVSQATPTQTRTWPRRAVDERSSRGVRPRITSPVHVELQLPLPAPPPLELTEYLPFQLNGNQLTARDDSTLPQRCVCCGDTVDLRPLKTIFGGVRYAVCHDHCVSAGAMLAAGLVLLLIGSWAIAAPPATPENGGVSTLARLMMFLPVAIGGVALIRFACPIRVGFLRKINGRRILRGVCSTVRVEAARNGANKGNDATDYDGG